MNVTSSDSGPVTTQNCLSDPGRYGSPSRALAFRLANGWY
jgi:hypothetical protein